MTDEPLEVVLQKIADELDEHLTLVERLYARRLDVWREAKREGVPMVMLARASRVQPVTVRRILFRDGLRDG